MNRILVRMSIGVAAVIVSAAIAVGGASAAARPTGAATTSASTTSAATTSAATTRTSTTSTSATSGGSGTGTSTPTTGSAPRARLRDFVCRRALDPGERAISITAIMRPLAATKHLAVRFVLLRRSNNGPSAAVSAPGLNAWLEPSDPTLGQRAGDQWIVHHPVVELSGPALYRFKVLFRWTGADGHVIGRATRMSPKCFQPELRPDLSVSAITITPLPGGDDRYGAIIRNRGMTAAGPFQAQLTIGPPQGAATIISQGVPGVAAHAQTAIHFRGPACTPGEPLQLALDPQGVIDDVNPADNIVSATCPAS